MKKFFFLNILLISILLSSAQDQMPYIRSVSFAGAGLFLPSSHMKENSMIGNGVHFSFGHFQGLGKPIKNMQWGLELRLDYSKFEKDLYAPSSVQSILYNNGSGTPVTLNLELETEEKKPDAFHYLIGPSVLMHFDNFLLQPSILAGYASVSQEKFRFYSKVPLPSSPTEDTTINFYSAGHETNNGFVVVPGIKAGYRFHKNFTALISFEYSFGGTQGFDDSLYLPAGTQPSNGFDYYQLTHGTTTQYNRESKLRAFMINLQLAFTLPRKK